jgi:hypothetical protein
MGTEFTWPTFVFDTATTATWLASRYPYDTAMTWAQRLGVSEPGWNADDVDDRGMLGELVRGAANNGVFSGTHVYLHQTYDGYVVAVMFGGSGDSPTLRSGSAVIPLWDLLNGETADPLSAAVDFLEKVALAASEVIDDTVKWTTAAHLSAAR